MNRKKGFTLIEIIFSVAFLSIVSVIMLKLLFASFDMELKTDTMDVATIQVMNAIENIKSKEEGKVDHYEKLFDGKWQETRAVEDAVFRLIVEVSKTKDYEGQLYDISASMVDIDAEDTLVTIDTKHYYGRE